MAISVAARREPLAKHAAPAQIRRPGELKEQHERLAEAKHHKAAFIAKSLPGTKRGDLIGSREIRMG